MEEVNTVSACSNKHVNILMNSFKNLRNCSEGLGIEEFVVNSLEALMILERDEYLDGLRKNGGTDKGNGSYIRSFKSLSKNSMTINIPRTRSGDFKPYSLEFLKYGQEQVNELVLSLYRKGLTTRDISDILKNFFGENVSFSQVSTLAEQFNELRKAWETSDLEKSYKVIYCDALYITVKRDKTYSKEATHVIYGVREDNKRELLHISVNPTESSTSWAECFSTLKARKVEEIGLIVADGLPFLENEVHKHFPKAQFQKCAVHKMRNILNKTRPQDKNAMSEDIKEVFDNFEKDSSKKKAMEKLEIFQEKWRKAYPEIVKSLDNDTTEYYFTYIDFPADVRRMIYTTNSIESLNKKIRKATKNKQSFEKPERLLDFLFVIIKDFEAESWMKYPVSKFEKIWVGHN